MDLRMESWLGAVVQHRHGDEWVQMEDRTPAHNPTDQERGCGRGRIFYCAQCEEEIRVEPPTSSGR
jgi:hypothetical protein